MQYRQNTPEENKKYFESEEFKIWLKLARCEISE